MAMAEGTDARLLGSVDGFDWNCLSRFSGFLAVFSGIRRAAKHQAPNTKLLRNSLRSALMTNNVKRLRFAHFFAVREESFFHGTARRRRVSAPKKLQISSSKPRSERCGGHPGRRVEVWTLELLWPVLRSSCTVGFFVSVMSATQGGSLELGIWSFPAE